MIKKFLAIFMTGVFTLLCSLSGTVFADNNSQRKIEDIIAGRQDYLVFASLGNKDTSFFDVQVMGVIGNDDNLTDQEKEDLEKRFEKSINISGIDSYMYFGENDDKPRTGDNVLVSMNHTGQDNYIVKNGVFKVDSVSIEQFRFEVPETLDDTAEAKELGALYTYVYTDGDITDIVIKDDGVYYRNSDSEKYKKQAANAGISLLDEFGDPTDDETIKYPELQEDDQSKDGSADSKWHIVFVILVVGMALGAMFIKILKNIDKRYDSK